MNVKLFKADITMTFTLSFILIIQLKVYDKEIDKLSAYDEFS